jgi:hypothetical protein
VEYKSSDIFTERKSSHSYSWYKMLHEIFLSLLGFTGDIIIEDSETYLVSSSFDLFTSAERQQINRIVPLGIYIFAYTCICTYIGIYIYMHVYKHMYITYINICRMVLFTSKFICGSV